MPDTRDRLVEASAALFQLQGLTGTGIKQILTEARRPYSSLYHHFPGGKDELADAAIRGLGRPVPSAGRGGVGPGARRGQRAVPRSSRAAQTLASTDFAVACPIATVALEVASTNERLRLATAEVFDDMDRVGDAAPRRRSISPRDARMLAFTLISLLEGLSSSARP